MTVEHSELRPHATLAKLHLEMAGQASVSGADVENAYRMDLGACPDALQQSQAARNASQPAVNAPQVVEAILNIAGCAAVFIEQF